jgi:hypothetical protein
MVAGQVTSKQSTEARRPAIHKENLHSQTPSAIKPSSALQPRGNGHDSGAAVQELTEQVCEHLPTLQPARPAISKGIKYTVGTSCQAGIKAKDDLADKLEKHQM